MIDQQEITGWAERFGVAPAQIQRDHFVSHILLGIRDSNPATRFYGGTALCRTYLDETRLSEDVDLLDPAPAAQLDAIQSGLSRSLRHEYPDATWSNEGHEGDGVVAFLESPEIRGIKVYVGQEGSNTLGWEFANTDVNLRYSDLPSRAQLSCPTLETFAAMKLSAWYDRHTARDLFDLAGLAEVPSLDVAKVETILKRNLGHGFVNSALERLLPTTAQSWEVELGAQTGVLPTPEACLARAGRAFRHSRPE